MSFITNPDWRTTLRNKDRVEIHRYLCDGRSTDEVRLGSYIVLRKPRAKYFCGRDGKSLCVSDHQAELTLSSLVGKYVRRARYFFLTTKLLGVPIFTIFTENWDPGFLFSRNMRTRGPHFHMTLYIPIEHKQQCHNVNHLEIASRLIQEAQQVKFSREACPQTSVPSPPPPPPCPSVLCAEVLRYAVCPSVNWLCNTIDVPLCLSYHLMNIS